MSLFVKRIRAQRRPRQRRPVRARRRARAVRHRGVRGRRHRRALAGLPAPRPDRLRPARDRPLGAAALPRARALEPVRRRAARRALCARRLGARAPPLHEPRLRRGHRGAAAGARAGQDRALRDLVRGQGGARLRAHLSRQRRAAGARLRARGRRPRPVLPAHARGDAARAALALPRRAAVRSRRDPLADLARLVRRIGARGAARPGGGPARAPPPGPPHARRAVPDADQRRLRPGAACRLPGRGARRPRRRQRAAAAARAALVLGRGRAAAAAPAQHGALHRDHLRGDALPLAAHDAAGSRRAPARRPRPRRRCSPTRPSCPFDRASAARERPAPAVRPLAGSPGAPSSDRARCRTCRCCCSQGEDDLRTPVESARRVAAQFPQAKLVVAPATGHSVLGADASGCSGAGIRALLPRPARVDQLPAPSRREFPPSPPPPTALRQCRPRAAWAAPAAAR